MNGCQCGTMMTGKKVVGTINCNNMNWEETKIWYTIDCNGVMWCSNECPKGLNADGTLNFVGVYQNDFFECPEQWKKHDMLKNLKINESKPIIIKIKK